MSFFEHLEELRWHILRVVLAIFVFTVVVFLAKDIVFEKIIFGPKHDDFITYRVLCNLSEALNLGESLCLVPGEFEIINLEVIGEFFAHLKVSFLLGLILAFPYLLWEVWRFVKPGLFDKEIKTTRGIVFYCSILFLIGIAFGYFIITPFSLAFLVNYSIGASVADKIQLANYINYVGLLALATGLIFELPIVIYFLAKLGLITPEFMRKYRKHAMVLILALSAIITPPDVTSQILISFPVYFLYEVCKLALRGTLQSSHGIKQPEKALKQP